MSFPPLEPSPESNVLPAAGPQPMSGHRAAMQWDALFRQVANSLPAMVWMCGADGRATLFNKRWVQFTGCALRQALTGESGAGIHPDDAGRRQAALLKALKSRESFETEYRLRRADGEYRWMLDQAAPQFDARGELHGFVGLAIDITERKRAEDELRWLSKAVEQSPAIVVITDLNGNIEYVNPGFSAVTGYTLAEVRGRNPRILKSGETPPGEYRKLWQTIQTREWRGEFHNRKKNGELYWESASICPIRDAFGNPAHYIAIKEDITERKRMEAALRASEERLRIAAESAGIFVYDMDPDTGKVEVCGTDPFLSNLGPFDAWARAIHPGDRERVMAAIERRRAGRREFREEYRLVHPDGTIRHYRDYGAPECAGRWIGALRDITGSKQAEEGLARLAAIVQCSSDAIVSADMAGAIRSWNPAAEMLYGYTAAEMLGRPAVTLLPPDRPHEEAEARMAQLRRGLTIGACETVHVRKDGGLFPVSLVASPIMDAEGHVVGHSATIRDISAQKRTQEALLESENRFRALIQNSNDVTTLIDPEGHILYDSPGVSDLLGVAPEQRLGCGLFQWIHPDDLSHVRMLHEELLRAPGARLRAQLRLRHAGGSWRWCDSWASNLLEEPGVRALVISFRDITGLKGVETALRESEERYRKLIEDASDTIFTIDFDGNLTSVNGIGERISGYTRDELLGMNLRQLTAPESLAAVVHAVQARRAGESSSALEAELIARDGRRVALEVSASVQFRNGSPAGMLCIARDISHRKRVERLEKGRQEVLEMVAQNRPVEAVLRRVEEMTEHYYPGSSARILLADGSAAELGPDKNGAVAAVCQGYREVPIRSGDGRVLGRLEIAHPGSWQAAGSERVLLDSQARLAAIALEHRLLTHRLSYQAQHDPLTRLPNRALLDDRLRHALTLARRQEKMVAVLYVDLDRFKLINDTLGHHVGDLLLQQAAKRLEGTVRESDTLARSGGDEFVAVLAGIDSVGHAEAVGERIVEAMRAPFQVMGHELFASASVGLSVFPADGDDAATLQKHADVAMYEAKNGGRDRFQRFAPDMNSASSERLEIENQLHWALERGELQLYYQPQFQLPSRKLSGVEGLLRWNHPKWGLVLPGRFVPVAEESGLIVPIGLWVLREACRQHRLWRNTEYPPVKIAVNISATQFMRSSLADKVAEILTENQMEPCYLELELTEGVLMRDAEDSARQIAALRALGVRTSIDDFGTGYSSLGYLQRLPIDDLKIDKCFVQGIDRAAAMQPLVEAIVGLAHGLHLTATAEGVETESELAVLQALGCDKVQGFLLGKPLPADRCERYWREAGSQPGCSLDPAS